MTAWLKMACKTVVDNVFQGQVCGRIPFSKQCKMALLKCMTECMIGLFIQIIHKRKSEKAALLCGHNMWPHAEMWPSNQCRQIEWQNWHLFLVFLPMLELQIPLSGVILPFARRYTQIVTRRRLWHPIFALELRHGCEIIFVGLLVFDVQDSIVAQRQSPILIILRTESDVAKLSSKVCVF